MNIVEGVAVATFAAAVAAAGTAWGTAFFMQEGDKRTVAIKAEQKKSTVAKALYSEISTFAEIYKDMKLEDKAPEPSEKRKKMRLSQNYTAVYENNADKIGFMSKSDAQNVVSLYTYMNALFDSLTYLERCWRIYEKYAESIDEQDEESLKKLADVRNAHRAAYVYQEKVLVLQKHVLDRLARYDV